jgi:hypothetical protein
LFVYGIARSDAWHFQRAIPSARLWPLLGVATALGLCGVLPAPARAGLPEWGTCRATATGTGGGFEDPGCVARAGQRAGVPQGGYEWNGLAAGAQARLSTMVLEGSVKFQTAAGDLIECATLGSESFARVRGPNATATPLWELAGCSSEGSGCQTAATALAPGEINNLFAWQEEPLEPGGPAPGWAGRLGYLAKATEPRTVGILYTVANDERLFPLISCGGPIGNVWVGGGPKSPDSFVSTIGPVDRMTAGFTEELAEGAPGFQAPAGFEHHAPAGLLAFVENHWEPVAITADLQYSVEAGNGELEIKADP